MAAPKWFDPKYYMLSKVAELREDGYGNYDTLSLKAAFQAAGYTTDADGLYKHFEEFGNAENVSPSPYFDANYYFQHKAADYFYGDQAYVNKVTESQVLFIKNAFAKAGLSAWDHYTKYGMAEGIDPNVNFSTKQYLADKLVHLKNYDPDTYGSWTTDDLIENWKGIDLNPVMHYVNWGQGEGLVAKAGGHAYVAQPLTTAVDNLSGTQGDVTVDENGSLTVSQDYDDYFTAEIGTLQSADIVDGLEGDDTFYGRVLGSATNDSIVDNYNSLEPTIRNVETILFRSEVTSNSTAGYVKYDTDAGEEFGSLTKINKVVSYIDADRFELDDGEQLTLGSDNSRASLSIEDVRHNSGETTIRFADADPGVNYWVYFDPQHLTSAGEEQSGTLTLELQDVKNADLYGHPLTEQPFNKFTFLYSGSDNPIVLQFRDADKDLYTGESATYEKLLIAFRNALLDFEQDPENTDLVGKFSIDLSDYYYSSRNVDGRIYESNMGRHIVISAEDGTLDATSTTAVSLGAGWGVTTGSVPAVGGIVWDIKEDSQTTCPLIQVTVELDNVGRVDWNGGKWDQDEDCLPNDIINGSDAGDLQIGSMALRGGIERMDVWVDRGSWLNGLYSTNDTLRMVTVRAKDINEDGVKGNPVDENGQDAEQQGQLFIGAWEGKLDDNGNNARNMTDYRHLTWTDPAKLLSADYTDGSTTGLKDVAIFDATYDAVYQGDINIAAHITEDSYDKYFKSVDGHRGVDDLFAPLAAEKYDGQFSYLTGTGDDTINMSVAGDIAADVDFELNINTGSGEDLVAFRYIDMSDNQSIDQKYLQNVTINTESGADTVWFYGQTPQYGEDEDGNIIYLKSTEYNPDDEFHAGGSVVINTGADSDVIYANQYDLMTGGAGSGVLDGPEYYNAVYALNTRYAHTETDADDADRVIGVEGFDGATLNNDITTGLSTIAVDAVTQAAGWYARVNFKGYENDAVIDNIQYPARVTSISTIDFNHAVINAIKDDFVLSHLISAKDGAGYSLLVESLVNGEMTLDDLKITLVAKNARLADLSETTPTGYESAFAVAEPQDDAGADDYTEYTGNNYTTESQVVVDAGTSDDLIVLGTNQLRDVVVLSGTFGSDAIVDFEEGIDKLYYSGSHNLFSSVEAAKAGKGVYVAATTDGDNSAIAMTLYSDGSTATSLGKLTFASDTFADFDEVDLLGLFADNTSLITDDELPTA